MELLGVKKFLTKYNKIPAEVAKEVKRIIAEEAVTVLVKSVNMAPVDTGKLVRSARLRINGKVIAKGTYTGGDETGVELTSYGEGLEEGGGSSRKVVLNSVVAEISYKRLNKEGEDIAMMLHEDLLPYGTGPYWAKKAGRGGKFLEIPIRELRTRKIGNRIKEAVAKRLANLK